MSLVKQPLSDDGERVIRLYQTVGTCSACRGGCSNYRYLGYNSWSVSYRRYFYLARRYVFAAPVFLCFEAMLRLVEPRSNVFVYVWTNQNTATGIAIYRPNQ